MVSVLAFLMLFASVASLPGVMVFATDPGPIVSIRGANGETKVDPDREGIIWYNISAGDCSYDNIIVYYRTVNMSAIGGLNFDVIPTVYGTTSIDTDGRVTLNAQNSYSVSLSIQTRNAKYSSYYGSYAKYCPKFLIEIYKIECDGEVRSFYDTLTCTVKADHNLEVSNNDNGFDWGFAFRDYLDGAQSNSYNNAGNPYYLRDKPTDGCFGYLYREFTLNDVQKKIRWEDSFLSTGLATAYVTFDTTLNGWDDNDYVQLTLSNNFSNQGVQPYSKNTNYQVPTYNFKSSFGSARMYPMVSFDDVYQPKSMMAYKVDTIVQLMEDIAYAIGIDGYANWRQIVEKRMNENEQINRNGLFFSYGEWTKMTYPTGTLKTFDQSRGNFSFNHKNDYCWPEYKGFLQIHQMEDLLLTLKEDYHCSNEERVQRMLRFLEVTMLDSIDNLDYYLELTGDWYDKYDDNWGYSPYEKYMNRNTHGPIPMPERLYFEVPGNSLDFCMKAETAANTPTGFNDLTFYFLLDDDTAPTVTGVYSTDREDDVIISVRFSEPVYIKTNGASSVKLNCYLNGDSNYAVTADCYPSDLAGFNSGNNYGSFTDTLVFRLKKSDIHVDINVTSLRVAGILGNTSINDLSTDNSHCPVAAITKNNTVDCIYDHRVPTVERITPASSEIAASHTVRVQVGNCSGTSKLYYAFVPSGTTPSSSDYQTISVPDGAKPTVSVSASGLDGAYDFYAHVQSAVGQTSAEKSYPNIVFDSTAPALTEITDRGGGAEQRAFSFRFDENGAGVRDTFFLYSKTPWTSKDDFIGNSMKINGTVAGDVFTTEYVSYETLGVAVGESGTFYVGFYATDNAGNTSEYVPYALPVRLSSSTSFDVTASLEKIDGERYLLNRGSTSPVVFTLALPDDSALTVEKFYIDSIRRVSKNEGLDDVTVLSAAFPGESNTGAITLTSYDADLTESGLYVISFRAKFEGYSDMRSAVTYIYVCSENDPPSVNYLNLAGGYGIISKYFSLRADAKYCFKDKDGVTHETFYSSRNDGKIGLETVFSNKASAVEYVKYMELQDLRLLPITDSNVISFNLETNYHKAENSREANVGDYWIAYKRSNWTTDAVGSWVYYYYGNTAEHSVISADRLPLDLLATIDAVSERIVNRNGAFHYIHEVQESDPTLDSTGSPYFLPTQLRALGETAAASRTGVAYAATGKPVYHGDAGVFENLIDIDGEDFLLATRFSFVSDENTLLFYKKYEEGAEAYKPLTRAMLADLPGDGEAFDILEYSTLGKYAYRVYVDRETPTVTVSYTEGNGVPRSIELNADEHNRLTIFATDFAITGLSDFADSTFAYVTVFNVRGQYVQSMLLTELKSSLIRLGEGGYSVEVRDRSGNMFWFEVYVNNSDLDASVSVYDNVSITVKIPSRTASEMEICEIRRNGVLISSDFVETRKFTQSGVYTFRFVDKYGNEWEHNGEPFEFYRDEPMLTWRYFENGTPVPYDPMGTEQSMILLPTEDGKYNVYTSKLLQFSYPVSAGYSFEFLNDFEENVDYTVERTKNETVTTVTILTLGSFRFKIWYNEYPNVVSYYTGIIDVGAPDIRITYQTNDFRGNEDSYFAGHLNSLTSPLIPENIGYTASGKTTRFVSEGMEVSADTLSFSFTEATGIRFVKVYFNGNLYRTLSSSDNLAFTMNRYGDYRIVACDVLGNSSSVSFTNRQKKVNEILVDGKKEEWGHSELTATLREPGEIRFLIRGENGDFFLTYRFDGKQIYRMDYELIPMEGNESKTVVIRISDPLFDVEEAVTGTDYMIDERGIAAMIDSSGTLVFRCTVPETATSETTVEVRVDGTSMDEPVHGIYHLSHEKTALSLHDRDGLAIDDPEEGTTLYLSKGISIGSVPENATVLIAYSANGLFDESVAMKPNTVYSDNGYYRITVENRYHNVRVYYAVLSDTFLVSAQVTNADDTTWQFGYAYTGNLYSNARVNIFAMTENAVFTVLKDGVPFGTVAHPDGNGALVLTLTEAGEYDVTVRDICGNEWQRTVTICENRPLSLPNGILKGYNPDARPGYTNTTLSVDLSLLEQAGIRYLSLRNGDLTKVLYDGISENGVAYAAENFSSLLGTLGDGEYVILFRDGYGNRATVTVRYRSTPTLEVARVTRNTTEAEILSLSEIVRNGAWSNNQFILNGSPLSTLTVNGKAAENSHYLAKFTSTTNEGEQVYEITYLDEYGYRLNFTATLYRHEIGITVPDSLHVQDLNGTLTTRKDVSICFEDASASYTLNGGAPIPYESGTVLNGEGVYVFTVTDRAGNTASKLIVRDTVVQYEIVEIATGKPCISGEVIGTNRVTFRSLNGDLATIERVCLNGVEVPAGEFLTGNGKWDILVTDAAGNRSYFCLYMIWHEIAPFEYFTPYGYKIDSVMHSFGEAKNDYLSDVVDYEDYSGFYFKEPGVYSVLMSNVIGEKLNFGITVETAPPAVGLVGAEEGSVTLEEVSLTGLKEHDTVYIYRNEVLVDTVEITSGSSAPVITESGEYRIVIESRAGNVTELQFVKKYVPNTAGSTLIILVITVLAIALFVGMVYRTKIKVDR
ncbi:MAG: hypothetical protein MJ082_00810 [Clostridia bacterium]|nr:hypothetical protein [Clostridia bacterium]